MGTQQLNPCPPIGQKQPKKVVVLMVPYPAQGHLNQLLHLSRRISAHDVEVYYFGTTTQNHQVRQRMHGWDPLNIANIHFHEFPSLSFQSSPSVPCCNTNYASTKFPSHLLRPLSHDDSLILHRSFNALLCNLSARSRRVVIVHDSLMGSVIQDFVKFPNAVSYAFHSVSAFTILFFLWESMGKPFPIDQEILEDLPSLEGCFSHEFLKFVKKQHDYMKLNSGRIYNTCRVIERPFLELLAKLPQVNGNKKQWALGPFNPVAIENKSNHKCLQWLDKQAPNSVILVSFGTTTSLSDEQIKELAMGLEKSDQNFIWVLRDEDKGDVLNGEVERIELPKGFEKRMENRGIIVRDWAPQLEILGHSATGGFVSHCGWNSCMESISMGVPIVAWPMHSDQPRNAILMANVLKIGIVLRDWAFRNEIIKSLAVESAVRKLMASEEGDVLRKRAAEMGGAVRRAVAEGGVARRELNSFISHITR